MMTYTILIRTSLLCVLATLASCSAWATYPKIPGALQIGRPELEPVPSIMAEAIRYSNERYLDNEAAAFNLPEDTPAPVYESVQRRLSDRFHPLRETGEAAVHVQQVRVRANDAQVDVAYPRDDGLYQLVTLYMNQRMLHKYEVHSTRRWRIYVEAPQPNFPQQEQPIEVEADSSKNSEAVMVADDADAEAESEMESDDSDAAADDAE